MPGSSPEIANEFIRLGQMNGVVLTQMQLQKLVYIAHGWNLAINDERLTTDSPEAWDYGPVYRALRQALRDYGSEPVTRLIRNTDFFDGWQSWGAQGTAVANLSEAEKQVINRVFDDYAKFHAFQLSALTHKDGTPWTEVYDNGEGRFDAIPAGMIKDHFVELARAK